jgi:prophage maintenance system killer protein
MITIEVVIGVHAVLIKRYGGSPGIRDEGALQSAVNRPYQTFDGEELYKTNALIFNKTNGMRTLWVSIWDIEYNKFGI